MSIDSRLAKLEAKTNGSVIVVWRHLGETNEQATARWSAERAGRIWRAPAVGMVLATLVRSNNAQRFLNESPHRGGTRSTHRGPSHSAHV
jgi:hypothetical protein